MNDNQHQQLIETLIAQTTAVREIHALIVRIILWSAVAGLASVVWTFVNTPV
jgi:hypothetical protein